MPFTDTYQITIDQTFLTNVPVPVLVIDPPYFQVDNPEPGFNTTVLVNITNYGLKELEEVTLSRDSLPTGSLEPLIDYLPVLNAMETITVPVRITWDGPLDQAASSYGSCVAGAVLPGGAIVDMANYLMNTRGQTFSILNGSARVVAGGFIATVLTVLSIPTSLAGLLASVASALIGCLLSSSDGGGNGSPDTTSYGTSGGGVGCFTEGTPVQLPDGEAVPIEQVKPGDIVLGANGLPARVEGATVRTVHHVRELRMKSASGALRLQTTDEHRFWTERAEAWVPAADLVVGDVLKLADGGEAVLASSERTEQTRTVFNLEIADGDAFWAGGVLVHEGCAEDDEPPVVASTGGAR